MNKETFNQLVIAVIILYLLTKINKIFSGVGGIVTPPEGSVIGGTSDKNTVNKSKLTYKESVYKQMADAIEVAVWSSLLGQFSEDDEVIFSELSRLKTDDDFYYLSNIYKVRGRGIVVKDYYNLTQTITKYLDKSYKNDLNALYASRGMTIYFS